MTEKDFLDAIFAIHGGIFYGEGSDNPNKNTKNEEEVGEERQPQ